MYLRGSCIVVLTGALMGACASSKSTFSTQGTETAPGADAKVTLAQKDQNFELDLRVDHLLPPDRAMPGAQTYAVWLQPEGQQEPFHVGNLDYDDNRRRGELRTLTPHKSFDVFVTAEPTTSPKEPQGPTVISERVKKQ